MADYNKYIIEKTGNDSIKLIRNFDEMYKNCDNPYNQSDINNIETDIILAYCKSILDKKPNLEIFDIGSGLGYLTNKIKKTFPKFKIIGSDLSSHAVLKAKQKFKNIKFYTFDLKSPIKNQAIYNVIDFTKDRLTIMINVLYYFKDNELKQVFNNIHEIIGNGILITMVYLPKKQNLGKFIENKFDAYKLFKSYNFEITSILELENNDLNIDNLKSRKHLIISAKPINKYE